MAPSNAIARQRPRHPGGGVAVWQGWNLGPLVHPWESFVDDELDADAFDVPLPDLPAGQYGSLWEATLTCL
jgi:hypothetical protein